MENIKKMIKQLGFDPYLLFSAIAKSTDDYVYIGDLTTGAFILSETMLKDFGFPSQVMEDFVPIWKERINPRDMNEFTQDIEKLLTGQSDRHNVRYQVLNSSGEYVWVRCRGYAQLNTEGTERFFAGVITNLGDKGRVDYITGLFTQPECESYVARIQEKNPEKGGLLLFGLDNFSSVNNLNNHIFGDCVLRQFTSAVQAMLPENTEMFRFDGDQFAVVFDETTPEKLLNFYEKVQSYSALQHTIDDVPYVCTASAGAVILKGHDTHYLDFVKYATCALEESKRNGRNTCSFFTPELMSQKLRILKVAELLQMSVHDNFKNFSLVYQPLANADTLSVNGAEVLLRWNCEIYGSVPPLEFIPVLESNDLIIPVGKWVLENAVITCKKWCMINPNFVMNINVSYLQIIDPLFCEFVQDILKKYELEAWHIILELTESRFATDIYYLKDIFNRLRDASIKIAMDDFGTGYSSLGLLAQSPADVVKIDRVFVKSLCSTKFNRSFIGAVVQLCHSVNIRVCVEGVEGVDELKIVQSLCADSIQGYYISKPLSEENFRTRYIKASI